MGQWDNFSSCPDKMESCPTETEPMGQWDNFSSCPDKMESCPTETEPTDLVWQLYHYQASGTTVPPPPSFARRQPVQIPVRAGHSLE